MFTSLSEFVLSNQYVNTSRQSIYNELMSSSNQAISLVVSCPMINVYNKFLLHNSVSLHVYVALVYPHSGGAETSKLFSFLLDKQVIFMCGRGVKKISLIHLNISILYFAILYPFPKKSVFVFDK